MATGKIFDFSLDGSFGSKGIKGIYTRETSPHYFFFIHGLYGNTINDEKYQTILQYILKHKVGNICMIDSSRNEGDREQGFLGKTFAQELQDVTSAFDYFKANIIATKESAKVHIVGFSMGGIIGSFLLDKYTVSSILLFGSGFPPKDLLSHSILTSHPSKEEILNNFAPFAGDIYLIQGSEDTTIPQIEAREIIFIPKIAKKKELIILNGIDHSFRFNSGKNDVENISLIITQKLANISLGTLS